MSDVHAPTWAEAFHDEVTKWIKPYLSLYSRYGFDADDVAQECRLALLEQQTYLEKLWIEKNRHGRVAEEDMRRVARIIALRAARRQLLGRAKTPTPVFDTGPNGWEVVFAAESREHEAHVQIEIAEAIEHAPEVIRMYLTHLFGQAKMESPEEVAVLKDIHSAAAHWLLGWFSTRTHWRKK